MNQFLKKKLNPKPICEVRVVVVKTDEEGG